MKTITKIIAIILYTAIPIILSAQPHPYDQTYGGGEGSYPVGGGAPITGGLLILISLGIGYGIKRVYDLRKKVIE